MSPSTAEWLDRGFSPREKVALAEIVAAYSRARWLLWRTDLPTTVAGSALQARGDGDVIRRRAGLRLGRAIGKTLRHLPVRLAMPDALARPDDASRAARIESSLVIAVTPEPGVPRARLGRDRRRPLLEPAGPPVSRMVEI